MKAKEESLTSQLSRSIDQIATLSELYQCFQKTLLDEGIRYWTYISFHKDGMPHFAGNFPKLWQMRYEEKKYLTIDPIACEATSATMPFLWKEVIDRTNLTKEQVELLDEAKEFGIVDGLGIPTWTTHPKPGLVSLIPKKSKIRDFKQYAKSKEVDLVALINLFHVTAQGLLESSDEKNASLTPREQQCLDLLVAGRSNVQIADELKLSCRIVAFHITNIKEKYGVTTRIQLLSRILHSIR